MNWSLVLKLLPVLLTIPEVQAEIKRVEASFAAGSSGPFTLNFSTWPEWIKIALSAIGLGAGAFLVYDVLAGHSGSTNVVVPAGFNKAWAANGVQFYYNPLTNQYGVAGKKRFKIYRIRKPVGVVYSDGVSNLKALAKTVKAIKKQVKGIEGALVTVEGAGRKRLAAPKKYTLDEVRQLEAATRR